MDRYMTFTLLTVAFASLAASAMPALANQHLSGTALLEVHSVAACRAWARRSALVGASVYSLVLPACAVAFDSSKTHEGMLRLGVLLALGAPGLMLAPRVAIEQALLQARGRFYAAGLASGLFTGTGLLAAAIAAWQGSVLWCPVGLLLGTVLEYLSLRRLNIPFDRALQTTGAFPPKALFPWKGFIGFTVASMGVFFSSIYDQALLARMGVGSQALWGLAGRAPSFIALTLFAVAGVLSTVLFAARQSRGSQAHIRDALNLAGGMLMASVLALGSLVFVAQPLTALLYERGAFKPADTLKVAEVLRYAVLAYLFYPATAVLVRAASVQALHRSLVASGVTFLGVKFALGWWAHLRLGIPGIALATGIAMLAQASVLLFSLRTSTSRG